MRLSYALAGLLVIPWAFLVAAADFWWGMALGYLIVPAIAWWLIWRFSQRGAWPWLIGGLVVSYVLSTFIAQRIDGQWDYFFKPLTLNLIVNVWTVLFAIGAILACFYSLAFRKAQESA